MRSSWEIPLWVRITVLAKGITHEAATDSTALILQPSGAWLYFAQEGNLQASDKPHV